MTRRDPGHPRRDPPRRRLAVLGRRGQERLRARRTPADAHRHAVPLRRQPDPVRQLRARAATGCCAPAPTRSTATPTRCATASSGRCIFLAYSGETRWRTNAGDELAARLGEPMTQDLVAQAWRTALDPAGDWMPQVLRAADARLHRAARRAACPTPAAWSSPATSRPPGRTRSCSSRSPARRPSWCSPTTQGASGADRRRSRASEQRWMVAVRMVSEGVDIPRLAVGVYATSASTPLYFAQAIGRFVRARRPGETATVFLPSVPHLLGLASEMEAAARPRARRAEGAGRLRRRPAGAGPARRAGQRRAGEAVRGAVRDRRAGPGDLRRRVVRHRRPRPARPRRRSTSACPACSPPTRCRCC